VQTVLSVLLATAFACAAAFSESFRLNPGLKLLLAALAATGYGALHRHGIDYRERMRYAVCTLPPSRPLRIASALLVLLSVVALCRSALPPAFSEGICPVGTGTTGCDLSSLQRAAAMAPGRADLYRTLASGGSEPAGSAPVVLSRALLHNPTDARDWVDLGRVLAQERGDPYAYLTRQLPLAERCFAMAVHWAPADPAVLMAAAGFQVVRSRLLPPGERQDAVALYQSWYRKALVLRPGLWKTAVDRILESYPKADTQVLAIVPEGDEETAREVLRYLVQGERMTSGG
jgi:hypothetical protein